MNRSLLDMLQGVGAVSGSIHRIQEEQLILVEQVGLPGEMLESIRRIPKGKGMAGQAWLTEEPTTTCDLKHDQDAPIEPGARQVAAQAAIAIPVKGDDGRVCAVVGFAFSDELTFDQARISTCMRVAQSVLIEGN